MGDADQIQGEAYIPNSYPQHRVLVSPAPLVVWSSAYGKGKTRGIVEAADLDCRASDGNLVVLARKTLASMWATVIKCLLDEVIDPDLREWGWRPGLDGGPTLRYPNGSELLCVGVDNPGRLRSASVGSIYADQAEELTEEEVDALNGRLRLSRAWRRRLVLVMNPESKSHWIYRKFRPDRSKLVRADRETALPDGTVLPAGRVTAEVVVSGKHDNLENMPRDYQERLANMRGVYRKRYVEGLWESFEGAIFDRWDPDLGLVHRPKSWPNGVPPHDWPRRMGIDFGYVDPFVCQWWVKTPEPTEFQTASGLTLMAKAGTWVLYREIYTRNRTIPSVAETIKDIEASELALVRQAAIAGLEPGSKAWRELDEQLQTLPWGMRWSDHARQERALLEEAGIFTEAAFKDIQPGIQVLYHHLSVDSGQLPTILLLSDAPLFRDEGLAEDGQPTCTAEEIPLQRWKPTADGKASKEAPVDAMNHGCDAMRYCIASDEQMGSADVRIL